MFEPRIRRMIVDHYESPDVAWVVATPKEHGRCDDRAALARSSGFTMLLVADGATGVGFGGQAADFFINRLRITTPTHVLDEFHYADADIMLNGVDGDTTGIALLRQNGRMSCCSAGDSEAWAFSRDGASFEVTSGQIRKPRIGSGARPVLTSIPADFDGWVVVGSDGFWRWIDHDVIRSLVGKSLVQNIPATLLSNVISRSGGLDDDVTIAVMSSAS